MRSVKKESKSGKTTRSMWMCSSLYGFQRVIFRVSSSSFIVSRSRDLRGSSEFFVSCCTILATSATPSRARVLAMGSSLLRPMPLVAAHLWYWPKLGPTFVPQPLLIWSKRKRGGYLLTRVLSFGNRYHSDPVLSIVFEKSRSLALFFYYYFNR